MAGGGIMSRKYRSWLAPQFERFVALKRAGGYHFVTQENLLQKFDDYLDDHAPAEPLLNETIGAYLASLARLSPRGRDNVISVVWQALAFAERHGARIDTLPPRPPSAPSNFRLRPPRIISRKEFSSIIAKARQLQPTHHLRSATYATLYGLLFATGMRISEALGLDVGDLDIETGLLTVRHGKFDKTRVLPLKSSTVAALEKYISDPRRPIGKAATDPLFISGRKRRLSLSSAGATFKRLSIASSIDKPLPHLHDIRHSFTVLCVMKWYRENRDVNNLLPALSTYLGHISVENTRTYLIANGLLLEEAKRRFSIKSAALDEVMS
jgi:integrase